MSTSHEFRFLLLVALLALAACGQEIKKDANQVTEASTVSLSRVYQRVVTYDCNGKVVSDAVDTVATPVQAITISPKSTANLYSSSFENLTMNTKPNCVVSNTTFNVDFEDGWCNMRVASGANQIHYRFFYCDNRETRQDDQGNSYEVCKTEPEVREEGLTWIRVTYQESKKSDTLEIHPSAESCQPLKK